MTQIEKLARELKRISQDVTVQDRKDFSAENPIHPITVQKYLSGIANDADVAAKMIAFFKDKIESRNKVLA